MLFSGCVRARDDIGAVDLGGGCIFKRGLDADCMIASRTMCMSYELGKGVWNLYQWLIGTG